jgi:hypothetical protein
MVRCEVGIFDYAIHPFINFARDIGGPFPVLVFRQMPEQRAVAVFGDYPFHVGDQPFHNLRVQWRIPAFVALGRATRLPVILTDKQKPFAPYRLLGVAVLHEVEIARTAIDDLGSLFGRTLGRSAGGGSDDFFKDRLGYFGDRFGLVFRLIVMLRQGYLDQTGDNGC